MRKCGVLALFVCGLPLTDAALANPCPPGQQLYQTGRVQTALRTLFVPGNTSGMFSGVVMRKGLDYQIFATGSIRVGVFGETGTPPEGWEPQGAAGPGFPSPSAYTFSLIYRIGRAGAWNFAGPGPINIRLNAADPDQAELWFAINDTKTSDNAGGFDVGVKEIAITTQCRVPPPPSTVKAWTGPIYQASSGSKTPPRTTPQMTPMCAKQSFIFGEYCPGVSTTRPIPVEACTYDEARQEALGLVNYGCHLAEVK